MAKLLIVVDYQKDFVTGALGFEGAERLEKEILRLIKAYREEGGEVVFTKDVHGKDYLHHEEGRNLPIPHCIKGSGGEDFVGEIQKEADGALVFEKPTFGSSALFDYLRDKDYSIVSLCGVDTSICVFANAIIAKTALPDAHIQVYSSACGCGDPKAEEAAYKAMSRLQIEVVGN